MGYDNAFFALAPYGEYWREMRKIATVELLSTHRLEQLKHVRDSEILSLMKDLYFTHNKTKSLNNNEIIKEEDDHDHDHDHFDFVEVPMWKFLEHLTFNINAKIIAGKRFAGI